MAERKASKPRTCWWCRQTFTVTAAQMREHSEKCPAFDGPRTEEETTDAR